MNVYNYYLFVYYIKKKLQTIEASKIWIHEFAQKGRSLFVSYKQLHNLLCADHGRAVLCQDQFKINLVCEQHSKECHTLLVGNAPKNVTYQFRVLGESPELSMKCLNCKITFPYKAHRRSEGICAASIESQALDMTFP